jgi:hypothetical protein
MEQKAVNVMGETISVTKNVKIHSLNFSSDQCWYLHIVKITNTWRKDASKLLGQYLDIDDMTKIVLSKVLSKLWYAAPVWLSKSVLKQKGIFVLDSVSGNILRQ